MEIVLATGNSHKIREIREIISSPRITLRSMLDYKRIPKVIENGATFDDNAMKKARAFARFFHLPAIADDSGLEVKALNGRPGVRSARFAGQGSTKDKLCKKVLRLLSKVPAGGRGARFVCSMALALPGGGGKVVRGFVHGKIGYAMKGQNGFGYDPIFIPRGYERTFAQVSPGLKNRLSHRARAIKKIKSVLKRLVLV